MGGTEKELVLKLTFLCATLIVVGVSSARAQVYVPPPVNVGPGWYGYGIMRQQTVNAARVREARERQGANNGSQSNNNRPVAAAPVSVSTGKAATTTFRPAASSSVPRALAANASTPEARRSMEATFAELLEYHKKESAKAGVPANDVARATSFFLAVAYDVAKKNNMTPAQTAALKEQVRSAMLDDSQFQALTDKQKQETYETMAIMGEYIATGYVIGLQQKDKKVQDAFREVAKDQLERFLGTSIDQIRITDDGLVF